MHRTFHPHVTYSSAVKTALDHQQPVLALESTLITHGLPFPNNLAIAEEIEAEVISEGVTPATIAVLDGKIHIGLEKRELQQLIHAKNPLKASLRDLPYAMSQDLTAGTTVAATLFCADFANIKVFATGGIGGVHRGDAQDISADLLALSQFPVALVCAGAKAILDIPKTLEYLETVSVPVVGLSTSTFPAFYTRDSEHLLTQTVTSTEAMAKLVAAHHALGLRSGLLIANPIPKDYEIPRATIEPAILKAFLAANKAGIQGKAITPYLLSQLAHITAGQSIVANQQLILHNARVGARLAKQLHHVSLAAA